MADAAPDVPSAPRSRAAAPAKLYEPVDLAGIAVFRMAFGLAALGQVWLVVKDNGIERYWTGPEFHFTYPGLGWLAPWPEPGMTIHFIVMAIAAIGIALGLFYRACVAIWGLGWAFALFCDQSLYQNHFYLLVLVSGIMLFVPAHRTWSLDARLGLAKPASAAPAWCLWLLRFQVGVPYFFGGLAKLNADWLLGEPMRAWILPYRDAPLVGVLCRQDWAPYFFSYGGALLDLFIVPLLLWRRTRVLAFLLALGFHLSNAFLWEIGVFPWLMIAATTLFFEPDWPRRVLRRIGLRSPAIEPALRATPAAAPGQITWPRRAGLALLGLYVAMQCLLPLRHFLYPGNPDWTEQGHRFAWRMMLASKPAIVQFEVVDAAGGERWTVRPEDELSVKQALIMPRKPDMILAFAHHLAAERRAEGRSDVQVFANAWASLHGRAPQRLIDPDVDLAAQPRTLRAAPWILPVTEPLWQTDEARLEAFFREAAENRRVWTIHAGGRFPTPPARSGARAQPFWSSRPRAEIYFQSLRAELGFALFEVTLEQFRDLWLPRLSADGIRIGVNWSGDPSRGLDVPAGIVGREWTEVSSDQ